MRLSRAQQSGARAREIETRDNSPEQARVLLFRLLLFVGLFLALLKQADEPRRRIA